MNRTDLEKRLRDNPFGQLYSVVYELLFDEIVTMKLIPGMKLSETQIANELNISRTPVSDALKQLEEKQLIEKLPGKGYIVSPIKSDDCDAIFDVRRMIECESARLACQLITDEQLQELEEVLGMMRKQLYKVNLDDYYSYDNKFHDIIVAASGNEYLKEAYESIKHMFVRYRAFIIYVSWGKTTYPKNTVNPYLLSFREHQAIFNAIKLGFQDVAQDQMRIHLNNMLEDVKILITKYFAKPGDLFG